MPKAHYGVPKAEAPEAQEPFARTRFVQLCSQMEGFGKPGTVPTTHLNPMDLRHSQHSQHSPDSPDAIGQIDTVEHGWDDSERQARLWADRGLTIRQAIYTLAPPTENNSANYLAFVCNGLALDPEVPLSQALKILATGLRT